MLTHSPPYSHSISRYCLRRPEFNSHSLTYYRRAPPHIHTHTATMAHPRAPIALPRLYNDHPFTQIKTQHYDNDPSIIILTLYRPKKHNAFTNTMMLELEQAYGMFDVDDRVKCIVFTGHGKIFCAGADLDVGFKVNGEPTNEHRDGYV